MDKVEDGNIFFNLTGVDLENFEYDMVILSQELSDEDDIGEDIEEELKGRGNE